MKEERMTSQTGKKADAGPRKSELLQTIADLKKNSPSRIFGRGIRALSGDEIIRLEEKGNHSQDWG